MGSHAAVAAELLGREHVAAVLADFRGPGISHRDKALFGLVEKAGTASWRVTRDDVEAVRDAGWSDEAIHDALTVVAVFKYYNTWIDATGVHDLPATAYDMMAKRMATVGYAPLEH